MPNRFCKFGIIKNIRLSVLEKKALAFEKLAALNNEEGIDAILAHSEKLNLPEKAMYLIC